VRSQELLLLLLLLLLVSSSSMHLGKDSACQQCWLQEKFQFRMMEKGYMDYVPSSDHHGGS
jgi:hypothetical protein